MRHEQARDLIREIRVGTSKPFGVNLFLPSDLLPPVPEKGRAPSIACRGRSTRLARATARQYHAFRELASMDEVSDSARGFGSEAGMRDIR